jgi:hypothetical protein
LIPGTISSGLFAKGMAFSPAFHNSPQCLTVVLKPKYFKKSRLGVALWLSPDFKK